MNRKQFSAALRTALMQLDDLQSLERSPLISLLPVGAAGDALALQQHLIATIERMQEAKTAPTDQMYDILYYRYVEQMTQRTLSYQLGISMRHLRRLQENAISLLADRLLKHSAASQALEMNLSERSPAATGGPNSGASRGVTDEIAWLREGFGTESSNLYKEFQEAIKEGHILAKHYQFRISHPSLLQHHLVAVPAQVLRQSLLAVLSYAVTTLAALANLKDRSLLVEIEATYPLATVTFQQRELLAAGEEIALDSAPLQMTEQVLAPFGGQITLVSMSPLRITLSVPSVGGVPILLLDDNPDARQLIQRYAEQSPFRVIATAESSHLIEQAQQWAVRAILIDIMMPDADGWDLLARLRHHPATKEIPVVVCTILPQKELAHLLGASVFLQKPISQQQFLDTLIALTANSANSTALS
jgi:CheY-like chemotaxis protein